jgi:hypothetical protein
MSLLGMRLIEDVKLAGFRFSDTPQSWTRISVGPWCGDASDVFSGVADQQLNEAIFCAQYRKISNLSLNETTRRVLLVW